MKAMGEALKRKMLSYGEDKPELEIEISQEDPRKEGKEDGDMLAKKGSDLAPDLNHQKGSMNDGGGHFVDHVPGETDGANGVMDGGDMARHHEIMKALSDGGSMGHHSGSLHQRAADKAKEKFASIAKHKKGM